MGDRLDKLKARIHLFHGHASALDLYGVDVTYALQAPVQCFGTRFQEFHHNACISEANGDTRAHCSRADHRSGRHTSRLETRGRIRNLGSLTLSKKCIAKCLGNIRPLQLRKQAALNL
ncbi:hypothetical protein D3C84_514120 [compost metagenome]